MIGCALWLADDGLPGRCTCKMFVRRYCAVIVPSALLVQLKLLPKFKFPRQRMVGSGKSADLCCRHFSAYPSLAEPVAGY